MLWRDLTCLVLVIVGIIAFLYGANSYDAVTGWIGAGLFVGGIAAYSVLKGYEAMERRKSSQNP